MNDGRAFLERHVRATLIAVGLRLPRQEPILRGSDSGQRWGVGTASAPPRARVGRVPPLAAWRTETGAAQWSA